MHDFQFIDTKIQPNSTASSPNLKKSAHISTTPSLLKPLQILKKLPNRQELTNLYL